MKTKSILFGVLLSISFGSISFSAAETSHEKNDRTLTIQGQGRVSAIPDIATLSVEVSQDGAELDPILNQVRNEMTKVLGVVKGQGIDEKDVRTDTFQVHPKFEQDKRNNPKRVGYTVANRISIKVRDLKKTGKVLTAVLNAGATSVNGPDFEIDNPEATERLALAAATKDARAKAQAVADAAGVQLGQIITINPQTVSWPSPRRPMMMRAMAMPSAIESEEPLAAGEQILTGYVTITYDIH